MAEFPLLPSTDHPRDVRRNAAVEDRVANPEPFLEPVYLNEKMVLNCAAYIFKGYSLESETNDTTQTERRRDGKAGLNFLSHSSPSALRQGPNNPRRPQTDQLDAIPSADFTCR